MSAKRKLTHRQVARFKAIQAERSISRMSDNDNNRNDKKKGNPRSFYVNTKITPEMLAACAEAAGLA